MNSVELKGLRKTSPYLQMKDTTCLVGQEKACPCIFHPIQPISRHSWLRANARSPRARSASTHQPSSRTCPNRRPYANRTGRHQSPVVAQRWRDDDDDDSPAAHRRQFLAKPSSRVAMNCIKSLFSVQCQNQVRKSFAQFFVVYHSYPVPADFAFVVASDYDEDDPTRTSSSSAIHLATIPLGLIEVVVALYGVAWQCCANLAV
jgi:hypothetical protein